MKGASLADEKELADEKKLTPNEELGLIPAYSPQDSKAQLLSDHLHYFFQWALHPLLN